MAVKAVRLSALLSLSTLLFLWSRGLWLWSTGRPVAEMTVLAYAATGALWTATLSGARRSRQVLTAAAVMSLVGLFVSMRSNVVPHWLIAVVLTAAGWILLWNIAHFAKSIGQKQGRLPARLAAGLVDVIPASLWQVATKELQIWIAIFRPSILGRRAAGQRFHVGYTGSDVLTMRIIIGIGMIEMSMVHLLLSPHFPTVAIVVLAVSVLTLLYLFGIARSLRAVPTTLDGDVLTVRLGVLRTKTLALANIKRWESGDQPCRSDDRRLEFSIFDPSNVRLRFLDPVEEVSLTGKIRQFDVFDFRLDEPEKFGTALNEHIDRFARQRPGEGDRKTG